MSSTGNVTEGLIRDHFLVRGYKNTFKNFESELKADKESKLQIEPFVEETLAAVEKLDLDRLKLLWNNWSTKIFNRLSGERARAAKQYESEVYRLYLVRCVQKKEFQKCAEFFQKLSAHTQNNPTWTDWFAFPFNPNPQDSPIYKKYFDKQWREIFVISLHNFVSICSKVAQASQLNYVVEELQTLVSKSQRRSKKKTQSDGSFPCHNASAIEAILTKERRRKELESRDDSYFEEEFVDDFAVIAQCVGPIKASASKPSLKNLFKSFAATNKRTSE